MKFDIEQMFKETRRTAREYSEKQTGSSMQRRRPSVQASVCAGEGGGVCACVASPVHLLNVPTSRYTTDYQTYSGPK